MADDQIRRIPVTVIAEAPHPFGGGQVGEGEVALDLALTDNELNRAAMTGLARVLREVADAVERERDEEFPLDGQARTTTDNPGHCQGCATSYAACRGEGGRCCDLCQHPDTTGAPK